MVNARLALVLCVFVVGSLACKKPVAPHPTVTQPIRSAPDAGIAATKSPEPAPDRSTVERDIRDLVERWVEAQNAGRFADYTALYDHAHFRGQKRTKSGKATKADWAAWSLDRSKMFDKGPMVVAVEDIAIRTWLDKGTTLRPGVSEVRFVQRWRNPRYADHGVKILQILRGKILYEDMLTSSPGWSDAITGDAGVGLVVEDLPVPRTDDEAMALWTSLRITQGTVLEATIALTGFAGAERMAEALLRHGKFVCKRYVDYDECGESRIEWETIPDTTGWDDPCVQRIAAAWALEVVKAKRLSDLTDELVKLARIPPPEVDLTTALTNRLTDMPEKLRLQVLRTMLAVQCDKDGCNDWQPNLHVRELSTKSRIDLYQDETLPVAARQAAIDGVDLSRSPDVLVQVYGDATLDVSVREKVWTTLATQKSTVIERALRGAAEDPLCTFAMGAIEKLAERGKKDLLPVAERDDPARVVCLLLNASDQQWAEREFRKLLPKRGKILISETSLDEMDPEGQNNGSSEERIPVRDVHLHSLPDALREHAGKVQRYTAGHLETVDLDFDEHGLLRSISKTSWWGCPC